MHVTDSDGFYGAEAVLLGLCAELQRQRHAPFIVSIGPPGCGERPIEQIARSRSIEVHPIRMVPGPNPRGAARLLRLARHERADILHTHGYKGDILLGFIPARWRPAPLVTTVHGYTDVSWFDRVAIYNRLDRLALRRADRVVLVHHGMTQTPGLNRLDDPRWRVIENGIAGLDDRGDEGHVDPDVIARTAGRHPVIGAIGRLSPEKGFDTLIRAFREILRSYPEGRLLILGEGPERDALERLAAQLAISDNVLMPGYRPDGRRYLRLFDVFVLPSHSEGLPMTILEAMQAATPIVASRVGGVPAVLAEGKGGLLTTPGDEAGLVKAIDTVLHADEDTVRMQTFSRERVLARYSSAAMAQRYVELYDELTGPS